MSHNATQILFSDDAPTQQKDAILAALGGRLLCLLATAYLLIELGTGGLTGITTPLFLMGISVGYLTVE